MFKLVFIRVAKASKELEVELAVSTPRLILVGGLQLTSLVNPASMSSYVSACYFFNGNKASVPQPWHEFCSLFQCMVVLLCMTTVPITLPTTETTPWLWPHFISPVALPRNRCHSNWGRRDHVWWGKGGTCVDFLLYVCPSFPGVWWQTWLWENTSAYWATDIISTPSGAITQAASCRYNKPLLLSALTQLLRQNFVSKKNVFC